MNLDPSTFEAAPQPPSNLRIAFTLGGLIAAVILAAIFGGRGGGFSPLADCDDARQALKRNASLGDTLFDEWERRSDDEKVDQGMRWNAFMSSYLVLVDGTCDPDDIHTVVNPDTFATDEARIAWTYMLLDVWRQRDDFDDPPAEVAGRAAFADPENPPTLVPEELSRGDLLLVVPGEEESPMFAELDAAFGETMDIHVVDEGVGRQIARLYGWEIISPEDTPAPYATDLRPLLAVVRNGKATHWVTGDVPEDVAPELQLAEEILSSPYDPSREDAYPSEVDRYAVCDGNEWAGAVINRTDREAFVYAITDVNRSFDAEGFPLPNKKFYDLGVVGPGESKAWREKTGDAVYAPCWVSLEVSYTDGYRRPEGWHQPPLPEGELETAEDYLHSVMDDLPETVVPETGWPGPDDVTPVEP